MPIHLTVTAVPGGVRGHGRRGGLDDGKGRAEAQPQFEVPGHEVEVSPGRLPGSTAQKPQSGRSGTESNKRVEGWASVSHLHLTLSWKKRDVSIQCRVSPGPGTSFKMLSRLAMDSIRGHKLRSFLTLLGVIIGVASVDPGGRGHRGPGRLCGAEHGQGVRLRIVPGGPDRRHRAAQPARTTSRR